MYIHKINSFQVISKWQYCVIYDRKFQGGNIVYRVVFVSIQTQPVNLFLNPNTCYAYRVKGRNLNAQPIK